MYNLVQRFRLKNASCCLKLEIGDKCPAKGFKNIFPLIWMFVLIRVWLRAALMNHTNQENTPGSILVEASSKHFF